MPTLRVATQQSYMHENANIEAHTNDAHAIRPKRRVLFQNMRTNGPLQIQPRFHRSDSTYPKCACIAWSISEAEFKKAVKCFMQTNKEPQTASHASAT